MVDLLRSQFLVLTKRNADSGNEKAKPLFELSSSFAYGKEPSNIPREFLLRYTTYFKSKLEINKGEQSFHFIFC